MSALPTHARSPRAHLGLGVILALLLLAMACANSEAPECESREDCPLEQVCLAESCVEPDPTGQCTSDDECPRGLSCDNRLCIDPNATNNSTNNGTNNGTTSTNNGTTSTNNGSTSTNNASTGTNNSTTSTNNASTGTNNSTTSTNNSTTSTNNGTTSTNNATTGPDRDPPVVLSTVPASNASGVPVNASVTITFSEPVRAFGLEQKIMFQDADSLIDVPFTLVHDAETVTLTPVEPLTPATAYQVTIDSQVVDEGGNRLPDVYRWFFATATVPEPELDALAARFAPVVYQEVTDDNAIGRSDYFSAMDFDADFDASNNFENFRDAPSPSIAYYSVIETTTHYFIQYLFYYPSYFNTVADRFHEHDITGVQVLVAKGDDLTFVMAESSMDLLHLGFAVEGSGVSDRNLGELAITFPQDSLWEGTHYRAYNGNNTHGSCHWLWSPEVLPSAQYPWCRHPAGEFGNDARSIVYYPGDQAQTFADADCSEQNRCATDQGITCSADTTCRDAAGQRAITYTLESIFDSIWLRRVPFDAETNLFSGRRTYNSHPDSGDRPGRDENRKFPAALATDDSDSRGTLPFIWRSNGSIADGQSWIDPAWAFTQRYTIGANNDGFSLDYCYNPYLEIDLRGTTPECQ